MGMDMIIFHCVELSLEMASGTIMSVSRGYESLTIRVILGIYIDLDREN